MRITITHVTRMHDGRVCVAGVDTERMVHIRPVLRFGSLTADCLAENGGVFALGHIVDLGPTSPCGRPPEVEDHYFDLTRARVVGHLSDTELWSLLASLAADDPAEIFGNALHTPEGRVKSLATRKGKGRASLGVWRASNEPRLTRYGNKALLECDCELGPKRFSVTDTRLFESDLTTIDEQAFRSVQSALSSSPEVLLCVGLARPWAPQGMGEQMHWMQVNGIHIAPGSERGGQQSAELFERLRRLRKRLADEEGVPAFVVFADTALREMADRRPITRDQLLRIRGIGPGELKKYGDVFLAEIARYLNEIKDRG